jgi:hypothetical protein
MQERIDSWSALPVKGERTIHLEAFADSLRKGLPFETHINTVTINLTIGDRPEKRLQATQAFARQVSALGSLSVSLRLLFAHELSTS